MDCLPTSCRIGRTPPIPMYFPPTLNIGNVTQLTPILGQKVARSFFEFPEGKCTLIGCKRYLPHAFIKHSWCRVSVQQSAVCASRYGQ